MYLIFLSLSTQTKNLWDFVSEKDYLNWLIALMAETQNDYLARAMHFKLI